MENNVKQIFNNAAIFCGEDYKLSTDFNAFIESSNKLTLILPTKTKSEYKNLSIWEQLFISNFYNSQIRKP